MTTDAQQLAYENALADVEELSTALDNVERGPDGNPTDAGLRASADIAPSFLKAMAALEAAEAALEDR